MEKIPTKNKQKSVLLLLNKVAFGGAEKVFFQQASALAKKQYDVHIGFLYGKNEEKQSFGQNVDACKRVDFGFSSIFDIAGYWRMRAYCKKNNIQVLYATLNDANVIARMTKVLLPTVYVCIREANMATRKSWKFKLLDIVLLPWTNRIIAVTEEVKQSLRRYMPYLNSKIAVLHNGIRKEELWPGKRERPAGEIIFVTVGSLGEQKNHTFMIDAFEMASKQIKEKSVLHIIGDGGKREALQEYIQSKGLEKNVMLIGNIPYAEVLQSYQQSDIFLLSSLYEGCPNVVLEAMAQRLPVITSRVSGVSRMITEGVSGYILEQGDVEGFAKCMITLAEDPSLREQFGVAAQKQITQHFLFATHITTLESLLFDYVTSYRRDV